MPEVGVESPIHFGQSLGELWRNGQVCCEQLQAVAVSCGNQRPMHKFIFDMQHGKFVFIYDDLRSKMLGTLPDTATPEDIGRFQELLQIAETRALEADRGYGAKVKQLEEAKLEGKLQAEAKQKVEAELKETKKELMAAKSTREKAEKKQLEAEKTACSAVKKVSELTEQLSRMKQSKRDARAAVDIAEEDRRRKDTENRDAADRWKQRALTTEARCKTLVIQAGEQKTLREQVVQEKGVLMDLLENAQQLREAAEAQLMHQQDVDGINAAEDVVTHTAATQTEPYVVEFSVVEFATQTEETKAKGAVESCIASVQTEAMDESDAQLEELVATKEVLSWLEYLIQYAASNGRKLSCEKVLPLLRSKMDEAEAFAKKAAETKIASVQTEAKGRAFQSFLDRGTFSGMDDTVRAPKRSGTVRKKPVRNNAPIVRTHKGDWICNTCKFSVFAKRKQCPQCGTRPAVVAHN